MIPVFANQLLVLNGFLKIKTYPRPSVLTMTLGLEPSNGSLW
jgi:hypothetical protein